MPILDPHLSLVIKNLPLLKHSKTIDAVQLSSGKTVFLKAVEKSSAETSIASYLSSEEMRDDPRNHCVPILDSFIDEMEPDTEFIVMPMLRKFDSPCFGTVIEVFDFVRQLLEVSTYSIRLIYLTTSRQFCSSMRRMSLIGQ